MRKDKIVTEVMGEENVLTPSDLYNHDFKRMTMGGYKVEEVDQFLERVADVMESLIGQVRELKARTDEQREQLEEYRQMEKTLRNALMSSQKFGENILEAARREADALIEEGRLKKARAEFEASRVPSKMTEEIEQLKQQRRQLRIEILAVVETHRRLVDSLLPEELVEPPNAFIAMNGPEEATTTQAPASESDEMTAQVESSPTAEAVSAFKSMLADVSAAAEAVPVSEDDSEATPEPPQEDEASDKTEAPVEEEPAAVEPETEPETEPTMPDIEAVLNESSVESDEDSSSEGSQSDEESAPEEESTDDVEPDDAEESVVEEEVETETETSPADEPEMEPTDHPTPAAIVRELPDSHPVDTPEAAAAWLDALAQKARESKREGDVTPTPHKEDPS